jgi:hypothetical protein
LELKTQRIRQAFIFAPDRETIDVVVNKTRQETEVEDEDDLNSSSEGDENGEYVCTMNSKRQARSVVASKKKRPMGWKGYDRAI